MACISECGVRALENGSHVAALRGGPRAVPAVAALLSARIPIEGGSVGAALSHRHFLARTLVRCSVSEACLSKVIMPSRTKLSSPTQAT